MKERESSEPVRRRGPARRMRGFVVLAIASLLALLGACAPGEESGEGGVAARDSRFVISFESDAPASPETAGRLRIRVEARDPWHVALEAPVTLKLEAPPGLELEEAQQRAEDAVQHSAEALEFASAYRTEKAGESLVRGHLKFGMCEGEDTRCVIVRRDLELPLEIAFR